MDDFASIATGTVAAIGPFLPYLTAIGRSTGKKLEEVIEERGGEIIFERAEALWAKIRGRYADDTVLMNTAQNAASESGNELWQGILIQTLAARLEQDPDFAKELLADLGGDQAVQEIIAGNRAWIENVNMAMSMAGRQTIGLGDDSVGTDIHMTMGGTTDIQSDQD